MKCLSPGQLIPQTVDVEVRYLRNGKRKTGQRVRSIQMKRLQTGLQSGQITMKRIQLMSGKTERSGERISVRMKSKHHRIQVLEFGAKTLGVYAHPCQAIAQLPHIVFVIDYDLVPINDHLYFAIRPDYHGCLKAGYGIRFDHYERSVNSDADFHGILVVRDIDSFFIFNNSIYVFCYLQP